MENEKINLRKFENCENIRFEDVGKFLQEQGYNWTGFINEDLFDYRIEEYRINCEFFFHKYFHNNFSAYNHLLIWTDDLFNKDFPVKINNNKFVRYIYFGISTFRVYTVVEDKDMPKYLTTKLEKNLSKEWVQYLAKQKQYYKPSLIQLMLKRKKQAEVDLESSKEHVNSEKTKLDKYLEKRIVETNEEITTANTITEWLEELN